MVNRLLGHIYSRTCSTTESDDQFNELQSRIINLNTKVSVRVAGFLFNRYLLVGDYFYRFAVNNGENAVQLLDIINVKTMQLTRIETGEAPINFLY